MTCEILAVEWLFHITPIRSSSNKRRKEKESRPWGNSIDCVPMRHIFSTRHYWPRSIVNGKYFFNGFLIGTHNFQPFADIRKGFINETPSIKTRRWKVNLTSGILTEVTPSGNKKIDWLIIDCKVGGPWVYSNVIQVGDTYLSMTHHFLSVIYPP